MAVTFDYLICNRCFHALLQKIPFGTVMSIVSVMHFYVNAPG